MTEDYYELLGVGRDADTEEIERAYRDLAARYHPDVSDAPDADERFRRIQRAKEVLSDEQTRRAYDRLGHERFTRLESPAGDGPRRTSTGTGGQGPSTGGGPAGSGFGGAGGVGGFGSLFGRFFGRRRTDPFGGSRATTSGSGAPRPRQGADRRASVDVDLEEAFHGAQKQVTITRTEPCDSCDGRGHRPATAASECPKCNGRGTIVHVMDTGAGRTKRTEPCAYCRSAGELPGEPCSTCGGDGQVDRRVTIDITVPAGVASGQTLRLEDEGDLGRHGGPRGDFLADVEVGEHPAFVREGDDLYTGYPLSFPQAVFGATVEVPTLDRSVAMSVPAGTQSGETFRLAGEGMPHYRQSGQGDLFVRVRVVTPEELSEEQRDSLAEYAQASEFEPDDGYGR